MVKHVSKLEKEKLAALASEKESFQRVQRSLNHCDSKDRSLSIKKLIVIGDSRINIQDFKMKKASKRMDLAHYHRKITAQLKDFEEVLFYHVLRNLNQNADHEANRGASLRKGVLLVNGNEHYCPIP